MGKVVLSSASKLELHGRGRGMEVSEMIDLYRFTDWRSEERKATDPSSIAEGIPRPPIEIGSRDWVSGAPETSQLVMQERDRWMMASNSLRRSWRNNGLQVRREKLIFGKPAQERRSAS